MELLKNEFHIDWLDNAEISNNNNDKDVIIIKDTVNLLKLQLIANEKVTLIYKDDEIEAFFVIKEEDDFLIYSTNKVKVILIMLALEYRWEDFFMLAITNKDFKEEIFKNIDLSYEDRIKRIHELSEMEDNDDITQKLKNFEANKELWNFLNYHKEILLRTNWSDYSRVVPIHQNYLS